MARTPSRSNQNQYTQIKTPSSRNRIFFNSHKITQASPNPNPAAAKENPNAPLEHPIEVIGRIRDFPAHKEKPTTAPAFHINPEGQSIRVRTEIGYRDFSLDGVSSSEEEDLEVFYKKFIESRIVGVKMGAKCTIMMYGPTGSGKSHNMFGCSKQPGIVYRSLKDILRENDEDKQEGVMGPFVNVTVLEIYNEEIYDLLSYEKGGGGFNIWSKASASKVRLEVMGKKAKNATFISGTEPGKISKEIQKVEKRRIVKSTNCNDRSSRSHCLIILDVPTVGGRLMLVDMAGSENIEQAGTVGPEAKMQTAKTNQGNTALKRVVESIANGDSHVPFRDSKLTMLLQDSFEDDKSRILMILCASPDPKEIHKTISTLEYGAKAKCIVRGPLTPIKDKNEDSSSAVIMGSRIAAMDQFILKLDMERKRREKECNEAQKQLMRKEEEITELRGKIEQMEGKCAGGKSEEEINEKVKERTQMLRQEMEKQIKESQRMAQELVELERKRMEEKILRQQQEVEMLRRRLEEMEVELSRSRDGSSDGSGPDLDGTVLAKRLKELYVDDDPSMIKSMELDSGDQETYGREVRIVGGGCHLSSSNACVGQGCFTPSIPEKMCLTTVYEEEEIEDEEERTNFQPEDEEVEKEVIEEKRIVTTADPVVDSSASTQLNENLKMRIQNIFTLCGNHRELSRTPSMLTENNDKDVDTAASQQPTVDPSESLLKESKAVDSSPIKSIASPDPKAILECSKENMKPVNNNEAWVDVYVKWEATKENPGKLVTKLKLAKDATLADLRKLIEIHMGADKQDFTFLSLGDASGAPVAREREASVAASKLPACNSQLGGHLACLRAIKRPFASIENMMLPTTPLLSLKQKMQEASDNTLSPFSPDPSLGSTPFVTLRRY